jgi:hypothetical protein
MRIQLSSLYYFGFIGMELSYLYVLASLFNGPAYIIVLILSLYPLALLFKLTSASHVSHRLRSWLELSSLVLIVLLVAGERLLNTVETGQPDIGGIVLRMGLCGITWLLGHSVPIDKVKFSTVAFRFQMGFLALMIASQVANRILPVFLFFLLSPLALSLAHCLISISRGANVIRIPNIGQLLLTGASVIVPGIAVILLFSPDMARAILNWLWNISMVVMDWMDAQYKAGITQSTATKFNFNFSCNILPGQASAPAADLPPPSARTDTQTSPIFVWIVAFIIFLVMVTFIAYAIKGRGGDRKAPQAKPVKFQLSTFSLDIFQNILSFFPRLPRKLWLWLKSLFERLGGRSIQSGPHLISIRVLYCNLLNWTARHGMARVLSQTPLEHLSLLEQKFPGQQENLRTIIEGYILVRYSRKSISREQFSTIKEAWHRIATYRVP